MWCRCMPARWTHSQHGGRRVWGCANKRIWAELYSCLTRSQPVWKKERKLWLPDSGRRIQVWPSCTSCSTPRPRRRAHEEPPRCCCMRQPGVQDTDGRKGQIIGNECVCAPVDRPWPYPLQNCWIVAKTSNSTLWSFAPPYKNMGKLKFYFFSEI